LGISKKQSRIPRNADRPASPTARGQAKPLFRPASTLRVAVLIESSRSYGRGLLLGVARYARERANWRMDYQERELQSGLPPWLNHWKGEGVLARVEDENMARSLMKLGVPIVDLRRLVRGTDLPSVHTEEPKVVQLVVGHFRERGFKHLAFCGFAGVDYSDMRRDLFTQELAKCGLKCNSYVPPTATPHQFTVEFEQEGMESEDHLARWLESQPKPVGIMACNDIRGQQVLNACRRAGIPVPEQVAVMGVDNDEVLCELSDPPLSSVAPDTRRIGYEAAALLDRLMRGKAARRKDYYVPPVGIVTRRSTDTLVIPHPAAAQALSFLRRHYQEPITLKDVAGGLRVTLRSIQDVFKAHVGATLHGELDRLRIGRAKDLLQDSALKLAAIATACGFSNQRHFRRTFLRQTGQTPQQYRQDLKRLRLVR
jgi:LacI family transcriptional regulator